jgi:cell division protein ZapE
MVLSIYDSLVKQSTIELDVTQRAAAEDLQFIADSLIEREKKLLFKPKRPEGAYLWGGVGRGKTMLMDIFFDYLPEHIGKKRIHFHEFMSSVHEFMHIARQKEDPEKALLNFSQQIVKKTPVLCFDEFHVTDIADAMILGKLFTALFHQGACVIMTSNWEPDKLYEGGLQRDRFEVFIHLLKSYLKIIHLSGKIDYRLQCLSDSGVYFFPLNDNTQNEIDLLFNKLIAGADAIQETLTVRGHDLKIDRSAKGVARVPFKELCEKPYGAEDYMALTKAYHTIFLENLPHLGSEKRNEAKRFIILIDTLYDKKTKLIISAETDIHSIYTGKHHRLEFDRTVSRLTEMQSSEYISAKRS